MVGHKFVEKFLAKPESVDFELIIFGEEPRPAYDRVHLSEYFTNQSVEALALTTAEWYTQNNVRFHAGIKVAKINPAQKIISTANKLDIRYDYLVLATGSAPFVPPISGVEQDGIFVYRTIEDLDQIIGYSKGCKSAAVIGGGLLGLEAAKALVDLDLETHVVELAPRLMPRQIDEEGSAILQRKIGELDVAVHLGKMTEKFEGAGSVSNIAFKDGSNLPVDMVVISAGIRPRDELATDAGLATGERGGISVNNFLQTSDPYIYAIGECALHEGMIYGLVAPGYRMAETAVDHIFGIETPFAKADMSTKLKLLGVDVGSVGNAHANGTTESVVFCDSKTGVYKKLLFEPSTNTLEGAILIGDASDYGQLLQMYLNRLPLPDNPHTLIVDGGDGPAGLGIDLLPDSAQICSCENVTKAELITAIGDGSQTIPALKSYTKSGTGCGSCVALMKDVLNSELEKMGVEVDKSICEHFDYTRQELGQIVRSMQIETFDELLGRFGSGGDGCEKCKPVAASLIATYRNSYLLDHQTIQDTNDYYLANIQKNGTYSVVPRVPGGEITPEQLIEIGRVAQDFDLYTKITGGQRIDLFGAYLNDLPTIWQRLNAVGLESGHAYAKGLRTVKSCVGEAWCRFGVQDSTTMAIELEHRYKGIRFPHKVKMAVSGCARECAEAQCKDVGVIATENGWNLYVCGNGGMKPRHADLFATDIDTETLIKYIDRFLMYYARTADHLHRTAKWMDQLPGGLAHLQEVVVDDKLGINDELEKEMQHLIDTYQDEWRTTVEDPEKAKRYRYFANSDARDPNIRFKQVRGQKQPDVIPLEVVG